MKRLLTIVGIVAVAYTFTVLAAWAEPRYTSFSHAALGLGVYITFAICALLHIDFLGNSFLPDYLITAFNTLIYAGLIGLLLRLFRFSRERHDQWR